MHLMETAKSKTGPKQTAERSMFLLLEKADISKSSFHQPEVTGAIVVGPNYNKAGVRIGGCIGLSYSDDGSNFVYTPSHIVMIPGNAGDEKAISEHLKSVKGCAKSAVGAHKYWRLDFAVWQEFIGINQIVLF